MKAVVSHVVIIRVDLEFDVDVNLDLELRSADMKLLTLTSLDVVRCLIRFSKVQINWFMCHFVTVVSTT